MNAQLQWHKGGSSGLAQQAVELRIAENGKTFDPLAVYSDAPNPTVL